MRSVFSGAYHLDAVHLQWSSNASVMTTICWGSIIAEKNIRFFLLVIGESMIRLPSVRMPERPNAPLKTTP